MNSFVQEVTGGGIAAMELVAKDLKAMGLYAARSISYERVCYRSLVHELTDYQVRMFNKLVEAWQVVLRGIDGALEVTKANKSGPARAAAYSQFWGAHQRFFLHVLVAMSGPSLIQDIKRRCSEGKSCVVQLVSTMEAATERAYARALQAGEAIEDLDITPRDQLLQFVQASFPTTQYEGNYSGHAESLERGGDGVGSKRYIQPVNSATSSEVWHRCGSPVNRSRRRITKGSTPS